MKSLLEIFFVIMPMLACAQTTSYYGWFDEGEGVSKAVCISIDFIRQKANDTISVIDTDIHNVEFPPPEKVSEWKKYFKNLSPFRVSLDSIKIDSNAIKFTTKKVIIDTTEWFILSYNGT